jgi:hypothetical protein
MTAGRNFVLPVFGHFMANSATHGRTHASTQQTAAQHVARYATYNGACGSASFLRRHTGTSTQGKARQQKRDTPRSQQTIGLIHDQCLQNS